MTTSAERNEEIARQAEADLNSYQAKTGTGQKGATDAPGVDSHVEKKFPGAQVTTGDGLSTGASYNKRIPPSEGGELDDRSRRALKPSQTRDSHFEGAGGPVDEIRETYADQPGRNDNDVVPAGVPHGNHSGLGGIAAEGKEASIHNVGTDPPGPGGSQFPGDKYYRPEDVPDSISAEGHVAPESVTQRVGRRRAIRREGEVAILGTGGISNL
ncbi:hypothetical protein V5O48_012748 [Marasmius crinis-equi]|uniref:Uncharacterized protein n=1 Tax=Marasmius crinis-equi TaxID=585013 RepID=A0ABR3F1Y5_9AGAR